MDLLPEAYIAFVVIMLGLIFGSFLDVLVTRFHTGKSINGRSRCMSCGHTLSWYELLPLCSYIYLRGRCRSCGARIPIRLFLMEICTGLLFYYVYLSSESLQELFFGLVLMSVLIVVALYDVRHMVIPHVFVFIISVLALAFVGWEWFESRNISTVFMHVGAAFGASAFFAALWTVSKGRWIGLGDAKLAFPLGLMLMPLSSFSMVVLSFWIGAAVSLGILLIQRLIVSGQHHLPFTEVPLTMKSEVPFAPFLIAAFVVVYFQRIEVLALLSQFFS